MDSRLILIALLWWVFGGLVTGLWMIRRGHDPRWTVITIALGPLFLPVALARVERKPRLAVSGPVDRELEAAPGLRVLVGLDGSAESAQAQAVVRRLLGPRCGLLMLAEVTTYDAPDAGSSDSLAAARERLAAAAIDARDSGADVRFEVLAGPPGESLRRFAAAQAMDLLVVGRRGRGLSRQLLGSVSTDLVRHSTVPVLVVEPAARVDDDERDLSGTAQEGAPHDG